MSTNASLLPHCPPIDEPERETRVLTLGTDEVADLCGVLASETATDVLSALDEEPMVASELAERVGTSLQNTTYHLRQLRDAGLVRVVDTWYSSRGTEMKVYAPVYDRFVIVSADADDAESVVPAESSETTVSDES